MIWIGSYAYCDTPWMTCVMWTRKWYIVTILVKMRNETLMCKIKLGNVSTLCKLYKSIIFQTIDPLTKLLIYTQFSFTIICECILKSLLCTNKWNICFLNIYHTFWSYQLFWKHQNHENSCFGNIKIIYNNRHSVIVVNLMAAILGYLITHDAI